MQKLVFVNADNVSVDLTNGKEYGITEWKGLSENDLEVQSQQVPFHDGAVYLDSLLGERNLSFTLSINDAGNLERRYELKRELISLLNPKLGEGYLYYTNDFISKRIKVISDLPVFQNKNSNDSGTLKASLSFTACDPYWEDSNETIVELNKGLSSVQNTGDVDIPVVIDFFTSSVKNLCLKNKTNDKKIQFTNEINKSVNVNTGFGTKSVTAKDIDWKFNISEDLNSICYSEDLALYCVVGNNGYIYTGNTLNELVKQTSGVNNNLFSVLYVSELGLFVAVGASGIILTSSDGENWSSVTSGTSSILNSVNYSSELNLLVAVGYNGTILTSDDGTSWTSRTSGTNSILNSVVYSDEKNLFVAVGASGIILTSANGTSWTSRTSGTSNELKIIIYSDEKNLFIAGGLNGVMLNSADGTSWTSVVVSWQSEFNTVKNIIFNDTTELFSCLVDNFIFTSSDGTTWTRKGMAILNDWIVMNGIICEVGENGTITLSDDGVLSETGYTITDDVEIININSVIHDVIYCKNKFFGVGLGLNAIMNSSDGINWEREEINVSNVMFDLQSIAYSSELDLFVAVGYNAIYGSGAILTKAHYEDWIFRQSNSILFSVVYSDEKNLFVAVGDGGAISTSVDGTSWTSRTSGISSTLYSVVYSSELDLFVVVGDGGAILTSDDGINWFNRTTEDINNRLNSVVYISELDLFVAVGNGGYILTSVDGINWIIKHQINSEYILKDIIYVSELGLFVAVGSGIFTSYNLIDWVMYDNLSLYLYSVAYSFPLNKFVVVGDGGTIGNSYFSEAENLISELTADSDMTFSLKKGNNTLLLTGNGNVNARLVYRNRFVGV